MEDAFDDDGDDGAPELMIRMLFRSSSDTYT